MRTVKMERAVYSAIDGTRAILVTADTSLPYEMDASEVMREVEKLLMNIGAVLPFNLTIRDVLSVFYNPNYCESRFVYRQGEIEAGKWLKQFGGETIVLGIQSIFCNGSTRSWFVCYWLISDKWKMIARL